MSGYIGNIPVPQATQTRESFTATASQTTFATAGYPVGFVDVWLNGVKLVNGTDFTATNGSDVVLTTGAAAGDTVEVISNSTFEVNSQNFTGGLTVNNDGATVLTVDRATSDGTLVDFKKDGITVGNLGVGLSSLSVGTGNTQLLFWNSQSGIFPSNGATVTDNSIDFGNPNYRFKDLYLSGKITYGANAIDGTGGLNVQSRYTYNDGNNNFVGTLNSGFTVLIISQGSGSIVLPFFQNAGGGVAWAGSLFDPDAGSFVYGNGPTVTFTAAGTNANTYQVQMVGGTGYTYVQRTAGSQAYTTAICVLLY